MSYAYVQIIGVFQNLLMFFVLFPMDYYYQHGGKDRNFFVFFKDNWKSIFINWNQLSVVALVIGTALHAAGIPPRFKPRGRRFSRPPIHVVPPG